MDLEHAEEAWDKWEIHCLILVSLSIQVILSLTADLRRRSASPVLSTLLWLAYLSADTVAVFVLGHLAVHAQGANHELMLFWAPFVLVHLGGQGSITAFSKQDNELWMRHLLGLVTQTAVALYVVSKSSWPDARLRAAMVLMFFCGLLKYAGRTFCLFYASPKSLKNESLDRLSQTLWSLRIQVPVVIGINREAVKERFDVMFLPDRYLDEFVKGDLTTLSVDDIMLVDVPVDAVEMAIFADDVPGMLKNIKDRTDRSIAYQYVAACLGQSYKLLYTKAPILTLLDVVTTRCYRLFHPLIINTMVLTYTFFQCISTAIALVLFASAQKEGRHSKADITVSYILLVGALVLDLLPTFTSILSFAKKPFRPRTVVECVQLSIDSCIQPRGWLTRKQWSEELAQYSMTRRYSTSVEDYHRCMPSIRKWILNCKPIGAWCAGFFDITHTPVTDDLKLFVLDRLLLLQTRRNEWDFASFRGERALSKWMGRHQIPEPESESSAYYALHKSLSSRVEFPACVLIWHLATDICYFSEGNGPDTEPDETKHNKKKMSREISHYIMYLVFKCDVMLTSNSGLVHKKAHEQLTKYFPEVHLDEKETVITMFEALKEENQEQEHARSIIEALYSGSRGNPVFNHGSEISSRTEELLKRTVESLYSPVLPLAHDVAQMLIDINNEAHRWELISEVWLEILFYMAPRCGSAFHYQQLSTGGEFITHVLFLMRRLGPFMPKAAA